MRNLIRQFRWRVSLKLRYGVTNRWGWAGRTVEAIIVFAILGSLIGVLTIAPLSGFGALLLWLASFALAVVFGIYWLACTSRLLGHQAFAVIGFVVVMEAISGAPWGGANALLATAGRTAVCQIVTVDRLPHEEWNGDRWRYQMRCPDGVRMSLTRAEADDDAVRGPLRYDPRGWVEAKPEASIDTEIEVLARIWLTALAVLAVQTTVALAAGILRVARADEAWDD
jgi:hypothetical protein